MKISKQPKIKSMRFVFLTVKSGLIIPLLFFYSFISAQNTKLGIQGILKRSNGSAVADGNYSLSFRIYDQAEGGTALWTETQGSVTVSSGLYNTFLGSVNSLNLPFNVDYFVGVSVGSTPEMLPRLQLTTAPYALSVRGSSNTFPTTGAVGIGTTSPTAGFQLHLQKGTGIVSQLIEGTTGAGLTFVKGSATTTTGFGNVDNKLRFNPKIPGAGTTSTIFRRNNTDVVEVTNFGVNVAGKGAFSNGLTVTGAASFSNIKFSGDTMTVSTDLDMKFNGSTKLTLKPDEFYMPGHLTVTGQGWSYFNSPRIAYYAKDNDANCQNAGCLDNNPTTNDNSINTNQAIRATEFNAYSDRRIKTDITRSDSRSDLEILQKLQVTDYRHRDFISLGNELKKGFIAQEVETEYPEAVSVNTGFLPDIYQYAISREVEGANLTIALPDSHHLVEGDKVQVVFPGGKKDCVVGAVIDNRRLTLVNWDGEKPEWIFIFGKYVDDFRQVDYDRIHTLNVSVTQELIRGLEALESEIADLKNQNNQLKERRDRLDAQVTKLESAISIQQNTTKDRLPTKPDFSTISGY
jgi:hypothetical protein